MQLDIRAFSLTCGVITGVGLFFLTWWIIAFQGATGEPTFIGEVYRGYRINAVGSVIGLAYGFVDGLIGGIVFAWLYNRLANKS